jgi:hypothetical protein
MTAPVVGKRMDADLICVLASPAQVVGPIADVRT